MEEGVPSTTSLATSRMRAIHTRCDPQPILRDHWADQLVPATLLVASLNRVSGTNPDATQALKKHRIAECGITIEAGVHFVAADLAREGLQEVLSRTSFDPSVPTFFSWLGVTMYLTREANLTTLASIAACSAPGSELVFSYIDQKMFQPSDGANAVLFDELEQVVKSLGEPFISGFHPAALNDDIRDLGLDLEEDCNEYQLVARYDPAGVNGLKPVDRSHVARVRVRGACPEPAEATANG